MRRSWRNYTAVAVVLLASFLFACGGGARPSSTPIGDTPTPPPSAGEVKTGVTYCTRDGVALLMDIYFPEDRAEKTPAIVYMHAGAWALGDKNAVSGVSEFEPFVRRGYIVATIDYRLGSEFQFPAQIQDAMCAVRYLREKAGDYGIDADRIAAMGASAGGHLAALLGVIKGDEFGDPGEHSDKSSRVQAVVDLFGPADLEAPDFVSISDDIARKVFGAPGAGPSDVLHKASPVAYVSADAAPFLIVHGAQDEVVPVNQSQALAAKLAAAGAQQQLVIVQNAGHGLTPVDGGATSPSQEEVVRMIGDFLDRTLKAAPATVTPSP